MLMIDLMLENILLTEVFKAFKGTKYKISYIVSNKKVKKILEEKDLDTLYFKKSLSFRIQNVLYKFDFFKFILDKFKIVNKFEKFIKKKNIDLVIFNNPSEMSLLASNLMYVIVFYELQHLKYNFFPEYKAYHNYDLREIIINNFLKNAFKVIACVEKDKKLFINYSLLDPSKFAINETKKKLRHPFHLSKEFNVTLQDFNCIGDLFHISWAIHALYAIPKNELKISLEKFYGSFKEKGFIAHACNDSHYINFHNLYNRGFRDGKFQAFCSAEDILDTLDSLDFKYKVHFIEYANTAKSDDLVIVEAYLQRCLFDDTISLSEMRKNNLTGKYLDSCNGSGGWRFPQKVALIELNKSFD